MRKLVWALSVVLIAAGSYVVTDPVASEPRPRAAAAEGPAMGWNTFYGLGGDFTEAEVREVAEFLVSSGLRDAGYDVVWLDGGWQASPSRNDSGDLVADPQRFPSGMSTLTADLHRMGLKAGIYTDAGPFIDGVCGLGSHGHYQRDADRFAAWGFDAVKVDFLCGNEQGLDPETAFREFSAALKANSSGRPMLLNICNPVSDEWEQPGDPPYDEHRKAEWSYTFGPTTGDSWRTETDIALAEPHPGGFTPLLRNLRSNSAHPQATSPGHSNDPDYLVPLRRLPDDSGYELNLEESRTQLGMWAMMAAPLIIGSDPRTLPDEMLTALRNPEVIAVDRDPLAVQGVRVADNGSGGEVWSRPLAGAGRRAVALLNTAETEQEITVDFSDAGLTGQVEVRDLWQRSDVGAHTGSYTTRVPAHGVALLGLTGTDHVGGDDLGGDPGGDPAVARFDDGHAEVFVRGADGALWQNTRGGGGDWGQEWSRVGGPVGDVIVGRPSVHTSPDGRLDVFVRGTDDAVWHRSRTGTEWSAWESLGGTVTEAPSVAWTDSTTWTVYARGADGQVWTRGPDAAWEGLGAPEGRAISGRPAAVADESGTHHVAVRTRTDEVWLRTRGSGGWSDWTGLGGNTSGAPTLVGTDGRVYLLARGADYRLWQRNLVDGSWGDWFVRSEYASGAVLGSVGAAADADGHALVAVRGIDRAVHVTVL